MAVAREMGMSEEEFWNSDPIFFYECYEEFCKRKARELKMIYGR